MKIVVCIKQIGHTYARTGRDPEAHYLAPEDEVFRINPYDEWALGLALRARDTCGEGEISLLTLGPITAEEELRRCMAMGADRLCQIDMAGPMDPWQKSIFLSRAIQHMGADLALCGQESLNTRNGQVGVLLAHHLEVGFVSSIRDLSINTEKAVLQAQRSAGRGVREVVECPLPAVCSVDGGAESPPLPTLDQKRKSRLRPIQRIVYDKESVPPKAVSIRVYPPRPRPKAVPPPDSRLDAHDRILQLLSGSQVEKQGEMLTGDPASQVEGILRFLKRHDLLQVSTGEDED